MSTIPSKNQYGCYCQKLNKKEIANLITISHISLQPPKNENYILCYL